MKGRQKVILRADAGKTIGFGHFVRSLALASYLSDDFECIFCTFNPSLCATSEYQLNEIAKVCKFLSIDAKSYEEYDERFLDGLNGDEIVVLDNYYFTTEYQQKIKDKRCRLVCIDDVHDRHFVADAVLTMTPLGKSFFSMEPQTKFLNGINHSFLRKPFLDVNVNYRDKPSFRINKIVLAMGGADPYGLTNKVLGILNEIDSNFNIDVIAGDTAEVKQIANDCIQIHKRLAAEEIVNIFTKSDIGIFPASTICVEALACRLPIAAGWYVDNQKEFYEYGVENGLFMPLGNFLDSDEEISDRIKSAFGMYACIKTPYLDFNKGKQDIIKLFKSL